MFHFEILLRFELIPKYFKIFVVDGKREASLE